MPARSHPRFVIPILLLLIAAGVLLLFIHKGQQVSRQADEAVVNQAAQFDKLKQVDPALVKWREVSREPVSAPASYVRENGFSTAFDAALLGGRSRLAGIVAARDRLYRWAELTPLGPSLGARTVLTGLAVAKNTIYVADSGNRVIWRLDENGKVLGSFGGREGKDKAKGLIVPSPHLKVILKPDGNLLVNNPGRLRVDTYSPAGVLKGSFGKASVMIEGFCGCCNPIDIALLPDGKIVTAEKGLPRVKVYNSDGTLESVVVGPAGLSAQCQPQLAVNTQGQVLVLDAPAQVVRVFERIK